MDVMQILSSAAENAKNHLLAEQNPQIRSLAVLDMETSNLPHLNFNRVGVTEICIYGFSVSELENTKVNDLDEDDIGNKLPEPPRVLHKVMLLFNPRMPIDPSAEHATGLNNYILENEADFDENAANTIVGFLQHLQQPVCLIAHNGFRFDYPILKQAYEKIKMNLPNTIYCTDSLPAFRYIDKARILKSEQKARILTELEMKEIKVATILFDALEESNHIDWRAMNEGTPKRPTCSSNARTKRERSNSTETQANSEIENVSAICIVGEKKFKSKRSLFASSNTNDIKNVTKAAFSRQSYKLGAIFERTFGQPPLNAHNAEGDVVMLMNLILYYGTDFLEYVKQQSVPLATIPSLKRRFL